MNCDLENSFLLVYLSGPLIIIRGPRGAALADPLPLSGPGPTNRRTGKKENNMSLLEGGIYTLYTSFFSLVMWQSNIIIGEQCLINYLTTTR